MTSLSLRSQRSGSASSQASGTAIFSPRHSKQCYRENVPIWKFYYAEGYVAVLDMPSYAGHASIPRHSPSVSAIRTSDERHLSGIKLNEEDLTHFYTNHVNQQYKLERNLAKIPLILQVR